MPSIVTEEISNRLVVGTSSDNWAGGKDGKWRQYEHSRPNNFDNSNICQPFLLILELLLLWQQNQWAYQSSVAARCVKLVVKVPQHVWNLVANQASNLANKIGTCGAGFIYYFFS